LTSAFSVLAQAPVSAQPPLVAPPHPSFLTDHLIFLFLFKHVTVTEAHANELLAEGKDDSPERHRFMNAAHLTSQEEALLKSTAADSVSAVAAFDANAASVVSSLKAQYPSLSTLPTAGLQQLQNLDSQRQQIVLNHMASLQSGMAPGRFQMFYSFAYGTEGPRIRPASPGVKPPAGVTPPGVTPNAIP
jgi:hypothetical protein